MDRPGYIPEEMPLDLASPKQDLCTPLVKNGPTAPYHRTRYVFINNKYTFYSMINGG